MSVLFFTSSLYNQTTVINPRILVEDVEKLYKGNQNSNFTEFYEVMNRRGITYFLTVGERQILSGDTWGYRVVVNNIDAMTSSSDLVYNGQQIIYHFKT